MKNRVPQGEIRLSLSRFTQPTRLIIQRLLLESVPSDVEVGLLRRMVQDFTSSYGVTSKQSERAREEVRRLLADRSGSEAVPIAAFSSPTQRVILIFASEQGPSSGPVPDEVTVEQLRHCLSQDMTRLASVGGGKADRARKEIIEALNEGGFDPPPERGAPPGRGPAGPSEPGVDRERSEGLLMAMSGSIREAGYAVNEARGGLNMSSAELRRLAGRIDVHSFPRPGEIEEIDRSLRYVKAESRRALGHLEEAVELSRALPSTDADLYERLDATKQALRSWIRALSLVDEELTIAAEHISQLNRFLDAPAGPTDPRITESRAHALSAVIHRVDSASFAFGRAEDSLWDTPVWDSRVWRLGDLADRLREASEALADVADAAIRPRTLKKPPTAADRLVNSSEFLQAIIRGRDWERWASDRGVDVTSLKAENGRRLRDLLIARMRWEGRTLAEIGESQSPAMTRERARQIVRDVVATLPEDLAAEVLDAGHARRSEEEARLRQRIVEEVIGSPRPDVEEIAERVGAKVDRVSELLGQQASKFVRRAARERDWQETQWTDDAMKQALMEASLYVAPFSGNGYDEAIAEGLVDGPSRGSIINRFGSWNEACLAAGITPNAPLRDEYDRRWTDPELLGQLTRFLLSDAPSASHAAYDNWRLGRIDEGDEVASSSLLRNRLGGWSAAVEKAWDNIVADGWLAPHPEVQRRLMEEIQPAR